ncbi:MAG: hypothetical protein HY330_04855 [Chloroflexi bacterium]|nr:hypothetical protein [Chloroflexota bacterium]
MCEFGEVRRVSLLGSGKGAQGWFKLEDAQVYHDHFIKAQVQEGVVVDLLDKETGGAVHVCLELDASSAKELAHAILETVEGLQAKQAEVARRLARA